MKIGIISNAAGFHTTQLISAGTKRGHITTFFPYSNISALIKSADIQASCDETDLLKQDIVLIRGITGASGLRILFDILQAHKVLLVDQRLAQGYDNNNKLYTYMRLQKNGIPFTDTFYCYSPENTTVDIILSKLNTELPIIAKIGNSGRGKGVFLIKEKGDLAKLLNSLSPKQKRQMLFQRYLPHNGDIRVFVVGEKVLGAMFRKKKEGEYRSNIAMGATGIKYELTEELCSLACRAARAVDLEIAGVDVMISEGKTYVIEVNRAPQFQGFMNVLEISVAEEIIKYCEDKVNGKVKFLT